MPESPQGVPRGRVTAVLEKLALLNSDQVSVVLCLLDDVTPSFFSAAADMYRLSRDFSATEMAT